MAMTARDVTEQINGVIDRAIAEHTITMATLKTTVANINTALQADVRTMPHALQTAPAALRPNQGGR